MEYIAMCKRERESSLSASCEQHTYGVAMCERESSLSASCEQHTYEL